MLQCSEDLNEARAEARAPAEIKIYPMYVYYLLHVLTTTCPFAAKEAQSARSDFIVSDLNRVERIGYCSANCAPYGTRIFSMYATTEASLELR